MNTKLALRLVTFLLLAALLFPFHTQTTHAAPQAASLTACGAAFVLDLGAVQPDFQLSLLHQPGLLLVGIDPKTHQALVSSGRQAAAVVAADLVDVIRQLDPGLAGR